MKKILAICLLMLIFPVGVNAEKKVETYYLFHETYDGAGISQFYKTKDGFEHYHYILIPSSELPFLEKSDDALLEAKKLLALAYSQNNSNERLAELFGVFDPELISYDLDIDAKYAKAHRKQIDAVLKYVKENRSKAAGFEIDDNDFKNYTVIVPEGYKEIHTYDFPSEKELEKRFKITIFYELFGGEKVYVVGAIVLVIIFLGVSYLIYKRG